MTHEDTVNLSQLVGGLKRALNTIRSNQGLIFAIEQRNAGYSAEAILRAGGKSLMQCRYWLEQSIATLEILKRSAMPDE